MRMRSLLAVPAVGPEFFEKAAKGPADALILDLEDAVFAEHKLGGPRRRSRSTRQDRLEAEARPRSHERVGYQWGFRDLVEVGAACPRLDGFMAPKVNSVEELRYLESTLDHLDAERPNDRPLDLHIEIETALGMARVEKILEARVVSARSPPA